MTVQTKQKQSAAPVARDERLQVRVSAPELETVTRAAQSSRLDRSSWVRVVLLEAAERQLHKRPIPL